MDIYKNAEKTFSLQLMQLNTLTQFLVPVFSDLSQRKKGKNKSHGLLVIVSFAPRSASTSILSTSWSRTSL